MNYGGGPEIKIDQRTKNKFDGLNDSEERESSSCNCSNTSEIMESQIGMDPNSTVLNDTMNKIQPISNYNFQTKLTGFREEHTNDDDSFTFKKFNTMFENIIIKDNSNI